MHHARLLIIGTTAVLAVGLCAAPAAASPPSGATVQTFDVQAGTLDVNAPATANLGGGGPGTVITGSLGSTEVTDSRAAEDASWVSSVVATNFETGGGTPSERVLASDVEYWSGPATATTGNGTFTPGSATSAGREPLDISVPLVAFVHTGGTGGNSATWSPTLHINVPLGNQAGTYTGTVTHSVG